MKRMLALIVLLCLLCGSALADTCYMVLPAEINENALLQATFGERIGDVQREVRDDGQIFFDLPNTDGPPHCSYIDLSIQTYFGCFGAAFPKGADTYNGSKNVWPNGVAECTLVGADAQAKAEALLQSFSLGEYALQSVTAYGRVPGYRDCYSVAFLQRLNGRAVYWSSSVQPADDDTMTGDSAHDWKRWPETNRVVFTLDDGGLVRMEGAWCRYEPTGGEITLMEEAQAIAAFAALGIQTDTIERCYFLQYDGEKAIAIPAWRCLNSFLHAQTGQRLQ